MSKQQSLTDMEYANRKRKRKRVVLLETMDELIHWDESLSHNRTREMSFDSIWNRLARANSYAMTTMFVGILKGIGQSNNCLTSSVPRST